MSSSPLLGKGTELVDDVLVDLVELLDDDILALRRRLRAGEGVGGKGCQLERAESRERQVSGLMD